MDKNKKILCICNKGNVRSVATKICLNRRGYWDVIAVGAAVVSIKTLEMLCKWADIILTAKPSHKDYIQTQYRNKVSNTFFIGDDIYGTPVNLLLEQRVNEQLDLIPL